MVQGFTGVSGKPGAVNISLFEESIRENLSSGILAFNGVHHENCLKSLCLDCGGYHRDPVGSGCHSLSGYRLVKGIGARSDKEERSWDIQYA